MEHVGTSPHKHTLMPCISNHYKRSTKLGRSLQVLEAEYSTLGWNNLTHLLGDTESCFFWSGPRTRKSSAVGWEWGTSSPATWVKWLSRSHTRRISGKEKCLVEPLQVSMGKLCCKPLRFWSKAMPSIAENCIVLVKQLLSCHWALVETEHLRSEQDDLI